tara:strand:+ start:27973 stop:28419 length:447 start_codon:yes stop_codon:yes gene_type:complete
MKICSVELKGNDAVICMLTMDDELFDIPDCRVRKVSIEKTTSSKQLKFFQQTFAKLMVDYQIDSVIIRERPTKGKFAGGAVGFKLEAAIQLIENLDVELMTPALIKESIKKNPIPIAFDETGLKGFQETAFVTAYAYFMHLKYADPAE